MNSTISDQTELESLEERLRLLKLDLSRVRSRHSRVAIRQAIADTQSKLNLIFSSQEAGA